MGILKNKEEVLYAFNLCMHNLLKMHQDLNAYMEKEDLENIKLSRMEQKITENEELINIVVKNFNALMWGD